MRILLYATVFLFLVIPISLFAQYRISGEQEQWHKITISFEGPETSENASPNPFSDFRLEVTFSHQEISYTIPGYFAADGQAAHSSSRSGNIWRVHFTPDHSGAWSFKASFRQGGDVAISDDPQAGTALAFDGVEGDILVQPGQKPEGDPRRRGRLEYVGESYLKYRESGEYFIKIGPNSPENLLAYEDFDNTTNFRGYLKSWRPHLQDWRDGDPTWKNGLGKGIIGAANYLAGQGQNVLPFMTLTHKGDDRNVFPFINKSNQDQDRYDCSKLDQWEVLFEHADNQGMLLHFILQETENDHLLDDGKLGRARKLYFRELIARFGHHLALKWNLGEENTNSPSDRISFAQYFYDHDPYRHPVVLHTKPSRIDQVYNGLYGEQSKLTGASLQYQYDRIHKKTLEIARNAREAGRNWVVDCDENGPAGIGTPQDGIQAEPSQFDIRSMVLWGNLMAGGGGVEYYFGYQMEQSDLTLQNYRAYENMWAYNRHAAHFFRKYIPFDKMSNHNELIGNPQHSNFAYCLADPGRVYAIYKRKASVPVSLNLNSGTRVYQVYWYNPREGGELQRGSVKSVSGQGSKVDLGTPPSDPDMDWVALVTAGSANCPPPGTSCEDINSPGQESCFCLQRPDHEDNVVENPAPGSFEHWIEAECADYIGHTWQREHLDNSSKGFSLRVPAGTSFPDAPSKSEADQVRFTFEIPQPGIYSFFVRSITPGEDSDSFWFKVDNGSWWLWDRVNRNRYGENLQWDNFTLQSQSPNGMNPMRLDEGTHTITVSIREAGIWLDKILISRGQTVPEGPGGEDLECLSQCLPMGTPCNDNDPGTINDMEDGNCSCRGTPIPQEVVNHWMEAECASFGSVFVEQTDPETSQGKYLEVTGDIPLRRNPSTNPQELLDWTFSIPEKGTFKFFLRAFASGDSEDSFFFKLDDRPWVTWNRINLDNQDSWAWDQFGEWTNGRTARPMEFDLEAGTHSLKLAYRENGIRIDKIFITNSGDSPAGIGGQAPACDEACPPAGTPCDDLDPETVDDIEDGECNCLGTPVSPPPPTDNTYSSWIEAECYVNKGRTWQVLNKDGASNNKYLRVRPNKVFLDAPTQNDLHEITFSFETPAEGQYSIFARTLTKGLNHDSFWFKIDNGPWSIWDQVNDGNFDRDAFQWDKMEGTTLDSNDPVSFFLSAGSHRLTFSIREDLIGIDKLWITSGNETPAGTGLPAPCISEPRNISNARLSWTDPNSSASFQGIRIYPNPAIDILRINYNFPEINTGETGQVYLLDSKGGKVSSYILPDHAQGELEINLENLPGGSFLLLIQRGKYQLRKWIIKGS